MQRELRERRQEWQRVSGRKTWLDGLWVRTIISAQEDEEG